MPHYPPNGTEAAIGNIINTTNNSGGSGSYGRGERTVTIEDLSQHFALSMKEAAVKMGMGVTTLKRICRHLGLQRWPRRELVHLRHKEALDSAAAVVGAGAGIAPAPTPGDEGVSWASGQTISGGSSGDQAVAAVATRPLSGSIPAAANGNGNVANGVAPPPGPGQLGHAAAPVAAPVAVLPGLPGAWFIPGDNALFALNPSGTLGDDITLDGQGMESLDILAAADFDMSVGNYPHHDTSDVFHGSVGVFESRFEGLDAFASSCAAMEVPRPSNGFGTAHD